MDCTYITFFYLDRQSTCVCLLTVQPWNQDAPCTCWIKRSITQFRVSLFSLIPASASFTQWIGMNLSHKTDWVWNRHWTLETQCDTHCLSKWSNSSGNEKFFLLSLVRVTYLSSLQRSICVLLPYISFPYFCLPLSTSWSERVKLSFFPVSWW